MEWIWKMIKSNRKSIGNIKEKNGIEGKCGRKNVWGISCSDNGWWKMTWDNLYRYFEIGISSSFGHRAMLPLRVDRLVGK